MRWHSAKRAISLCNSEGWITDCTAITFYNLWLGKLACKLLTLKAETLSISDEFQQASVQHVCPNGGMCCSDVFFIAGYTPWFKSPITGFSDGFFLPIAYPMASGCIMLCGRFFLPAGTVVSTR